MSSGIAGIYICISIGPVTASPTAQHPLPAGQKTCDWLRDLHRARRFIIQDRADPGEKQALEVFAPRGGALASWAAVEWLMVCSWSMEEAGCPQLCGSWMVNQYLAAFLLP